MREDNIALVVAPQVEQVAGQSSPQVDAGDPGQQGVLEAGSEVRVVCVQRQVGVLGKERRIQGQQRAHAPGRGLGQRAAPCALVVGRCVILKG